MIALVNCVGTRILSMAAALEVSLFAALEDQEINAMPCTLSISPVRAHALGNSFGCSN